MKFIKKCVALVVAGMATLGLNAETTTQKVISFNWSDQAGGNATAESGVFNVAADAWNNFSAVSNTRAGDLKMWNGEAAVNAGATFSIKWASNVYWGCGATDPVMKRYLDDGTHDGVGGVSITVSNIPFESYDVYIICSTDQGSGGKYLPWTVNGASYGSTTWGNAASLAACVVGENTLKVSKLTGKLVLQGAPRNGTERGCICALQIVEAEAQIVDKDVGSAYTATEAEELQGDIFNLTFDAGATLTLDKDLTRTYNLISEGSITVVGDYVTSDNLAKLGLTGVKGGAIRVIDTAAIPEGLAAPAAGWTYRYEGTTALRALPFNSGASFAGKIEIACPVESKDGDAWATLPVHNNKNYIISDGAAIACSNFQSGNGGGSVQSFVQNGGSITANSDNIGNTTAAAFLLAHWSSTISYTLNDGTVSVPNGGLRLGWDGNGTFTQNGGAVNVKGLRANRDGHNGQGVYNLKGGTLTLGANGIDFGSNGTLNLGGGKIVASETATMTLDAGLAMAAVTEIEVASDKTLTLNAVLSGERDLVKTGAGTLIISKVPNGYTGAIRINAGVLDAQGNRDLQNIVFAEGAKLIARETTADDGTMTITGVSGSPTVELYNALGVKIPAESVVQEGTTITATFTPTVAGKGCWMDYEFDGSLVSVGTDTTALSRDGSDFGSDASSDFKTDESGNAYALYTGTHPYRGVTYPTEWSCAIYGSMPDYNKAALITFGTLGGGLIGLISGTEADQVLLVRTTGNAAYEVLATMAVPNAATAQHLYVFTKTAREIKVYLDGKLWTTYTATSDISFGGGMQIASVHGTVGSTGIVRFDKNRFDGDAENETLRKSLIGMMRLYNAVLGPKAAKILSDEFPYVSPNGLFTREVSANGSWSQSGAWTKVLESGDVEATIPDDGAMVKLTASADATIAVNLDTTMKTEELVIDGSAAITFARPKAGKVANSGATTINTAVTIANQALDLAGGPLTLDTNGSICFDFTDYPFATVLEPTTVVLTGMTDNQGEKVTSVIPTSLSMGRTAEVVYEAASKTYQLKLGFSRQPGEVYIPETAISGGAATIVNGMTFIDADGNETLIFSDDDWIIVNQELTLTIGENLTRPAKIKVVNGGSLKLYFASGVTISGNAYNTTVRIEAGGVYDIAHAIGHKDYSHPIVLAGGTLMNSGIAQDVGSRQYWQNSVAATSTIDVAADKEFGAVNGGHAAHNYNLNGNTLAKTGAGQYTFKTATFVGGGTLDVQAGTVVLDNCAVPEGATLNFVVSADAQIIVKGNALAKTGTVTGAGTVVYENGVDTAAIYQDGGWTGTVWIKNMTWDNANLGREGAGDTAHFKLTGMVARPDNDGCNATMILEDAGATKALTISTNVTGAASYHFNTVSGSGTFQWNPELTEGDIPGRIFWLKNVADYSGRLVTGNYLQFTIGGTAAGTLTPGAIKVAEGATICPGNWTAKSIKFGRTLKVKGAARAVIATVAEELDVRNVRVTLIDAEGNEKSGYCLKVRAVEGGYEVSVGIKSFVLLIK